MDTRKTLLLVAISAVALALGAAAVTGAIGDSDDEQAPLTLGSDDEQDQGAPAPNDAPQDEDEDATAPGEHAGILVEEHEREDLEAQTGNLDLRVDHGHVQVIAWDKPAYHVQILQDEAPDDRIEDYETEVTFEESLDDEHLDLRVIAERTGTHNIAVSDGVESGDDVRLAIVAYVPQSLAYDTVYTCSGQEGYLTEAASQIPMISTEADGADCVPPSQTPETGGQVSIYAGSDDDLERVQALSTVQGIEAETIAQSFRYGDIQLADLDAADVYTTTRHGSINATSLNADAMHLTTRHGDVHLDDATVETLFAETRHGDIHADATTEEAHLVTRHGDITATGTITDLVLHTRHGDIELIPSQVNTGTIDTTTRHGSISIALPHAADTGYSAKGQSDYGDVAIALEDMDIVESSDEDGSYKHAQTQGFEDKTVQVDLVSETRHGDVTVVEGDEIPTTPEEDEDEADEGLGTLASLS